LDAKLRLFTKEHRIQNVQFLGYVKQEQYESNMRGAKCLIIPSQCYENFPRIVVECFARGIPVVASNIGSLKELVVDNYCGMRFEPSDFGQLAGIIRQLFAQQSLAQEMGKNARDLYEGKYGGPTNYKKLMDIYQKAIKLSDCSLSLSSSN
jgi:glycosyltransferase involved in cell wall biosynthesis